MIIGATQHRAVIVGASGVGADEESVSVKEGDSVTLNTSVTTDQEEISWYFNDSRIAQITGGQSKICTDDPCKVIFGDRLKLDHQTGSLTIMNTRNTDSGKYTLQIITGSGRTKTFHVSVQAKDPPAAPEQDKEKRTSLKEGESVPSDPDMKGEENVFVRHVSQRERLPQRMHLCILAQDSSGSLLTPRSSPPRGAIRELRCPSRWLRSNGFRVIGWRTEERGDEEGY
ncbi:hypothetical protein DPX16_0023 [Anabarilius grahami]|uniref:Immunoglobulin domain-containing protein n=1 Tax=Anabarilius grahami TaxID=495550 RepID=A0A3N0YXS5_ANAGA|nr:hypothetical protein DPX16_0023 [Anabarilius grahami]